MANTRKLRAAVIGCGKIARTLHMAEYTSCPDTELVAYCDIDHQSIADTVALYGNRPVYTCWQEMMRKEQLDCVTVSLPNYLHREATLDALAAGVHVLVEKPMALTLADADKMIAAAKKAKKILMVDQSQRFSAVHQKAREVMQSGMLGKVLHVATSFGHGGPEGWSPRGKWFFKKAEAGFGPMADLGIHKADLVRFLTGKEVESVSGFTARQEKQNTDVEDNFVSILRFTDGTLGTLTASWTVKGMETNYTYLYCEKGTLAVSVIPGRPLVAFLSSPKCEIDFPTASIQSNTQKSWRLGVIDNFAAAILGKADCAVPGEEGRKALAIILAADEASRTGKTVKVAK